MGDSIFLIRELHRVPSHSVDLQQEIIKKEDEFTVPGLVSVTLSSKRKNPIDYCLND